VLSLGEVQRVLQNLLREKVSIRNLPLILESLADQGTKTKDPGMLTETVRQRLARAIVEPHLTQGKLLHAVTLDPAVEGLLENSQRGEGGASQVVSPQYLQGIIQGVAQCFQDALKTGKEPVLLVKAPLRRTLSELVATSIPRLAVLSYNEVMEVARVESVGVVRPPDGTPASPAAA
jgi:flagellar biosynthesis protein FlhA